MKRLRHARRVASAVHLPRGARRLLYLLFSGHNQPGGGFVGGLVAGSAISLRYLAGGIEGVRSISRFQPWTILGTGLC